MVKRVTAITKDGILFWCPLLCSLDPHVASSSLFSAVSFEKFMKSFLCLGGKRVRMRYFLHCPSYHRLPLLKFLLGSLFKLERLASSFSCQLKLGVEIYHHKPHTPTIPLLHSLSCLLLDGSLDWYSFDAILVFCDCVLALLTWYSPELPEKGGLTEALPSGHLCGRLSWILTDVEGSGPLWAAPLPM